MTIIHYKLSKIIYIFTKKYSKCLIRSSLRYKIDRRFILFVMQTKYVQILAKYFNSSFEYKKFDFFLITDIFFDVLS